MGQEHIQPQDSQHSEPKGEEQLWRESLITLNQGINALESNVLELEDAVNKEDLSIVLGESRRLIAEIQNLQTQSEVVSDKSRLEVLDNARQRILGLRSRLNDLAKIMSSPEERGRHSYQRSRIGKELQGKESSSRATTSETNSPTQESSQSSNKSNSETKSPKLSDKQRPTSRERQSPDELKLRARARIDLAWQQIMASDTNTKSQTANDRRVNEDIPANGHIESAGILPLVREFFPEEEAKWNAMLSLYNAFAESAGTDIFKQFFFGYKRKAKEARDKVAAHLGGASGWDTMRNLARELDKFEETRGIFDRMRSYFDGPQKYWVLEDTENPGQFKLVAPNTPGAKKIRHDYGKDGNPNEEQAQKGALPIGQLLRQEFLNARQPEIDAVQLIGILGEIRLKYYHRYYGNYLKSPDPETLDASPIATHSPIERISYAIRAYRKIPNDLMILWQVMRMPNRGGIYQVDVTRPSTRDDRNHPQFGHEYVPRELVKGVTDADGDEITKDTSTLEYAVANDSIADAIEVRTFLDQGLTPYDKTFNPVRMPEDLTLIPYYWDIAFPDDPNKFGPITYAEYTSSLNKWDDFVKLVQNPPRITEKGQIDRAISTLIESISPFKALFGVMKRDQSINALSLHLDTETMGGRFKNVVAQLILRYLKNIYDQYDALGGYPATDLISQSVGYGSYTDKRKKFLHQAHKLIQGHTTLDTDIRMYIGHILHEHMSAQMLSKNNLFTGVKVNPLQVFNPRERIRREDLIEELTQELTEEEKKK